MGLAARFLAAGLLVGVASLCLQGAALGADQNAPSALLPSRPSPFPALVEAAQKASIPCAGMEWGDASSDCAPGDQETFLVSLLGPKQNRQWLVLLKANEIKPEEKLRRTPELTMYVNSGLSFHFPAAEPEGIAIHVLGPLRPAERIQPVDTWSGALVNGQFLRLGIDRVGPVFRRLSAADPRESWTLTSGPTSFGPEDLKIGRMTAEHFQITEDEQRSFAASMPALIDFFNITAQTTGLREILFDIVSLPWWKLVSNGGQLGNIHLQFTGPYGVSDSGDWGLRPGIPVESYGITIELYGKPALLIRLAATRPYAPLYCSAGIIAFEATRPGDPKSPRLSVNLIAARRH